MKQILALALASICVSVAAACGGGDSGPSGPSCTNFAGTWNAAFSNSCGQTDTGTVTIAQAACSIQATFPGQGSIAGTVDGNRGSFTLTFSGNCGGTATGTATFSNGAINGTYSGRAIGQGCCDPVSGSFTLTR